MYIKYIQGCTKKLNKWICFVFMYFLFILNVLSWFFNVLSVHLVFTSAAWLVLQGSSKTETQVDGEMSGWLSSFEEMNKWMSRAGCVDGWFNLRCTDYSMHLRCGAPPTPVSNSAESPSIRKADKKRARRCRSPDMTLEESHLLANKLEFILFLLRMKYAVVLAWGM